jgi:hypothetical protein
MGSGAASVLNSFARSARRRAAKRDAEECDMRKISPISRRLVLATALAAASAGTASANSEKMTLDGLDGLIRRLDPDAMRQGPSWRVTVEGVTATVIADDTHDRMRIVIPVRRVDGLTPQELYRLMQANFDTALDARYAIAQEMLWSTFIHPLSSLDARQFLAGLGQTINLARNYGSSYASGLLSFGGGDSRERLDRELIDRLLRRGQGI